MKLEGKVAFVTGAARGMGSATCLGLAKEGADIAALDICGTKESGFGRRDQLEDTVTRVERLGRRCIPIVGDVTKEDEVKAAVDAALNKFGKIHILVNCVGFVRFGLVEDMPYTDWKLTFEINLHGVFLTCKYLAPVIRKQGWGRIVNVSSDAGIRAIPNYAAYSAAKFAVIGLTQSLANEMGKYNVTVNAVCPAATAGEFFYNQAPLLGVTEKELEKRAISRNLIQGIMMPENVANAIVWLCTDDAHFVTGHALCVDGGSVAKTTYG